MGSYLGMDLSVSQPSVLLPVDSPDMREALGLVDQCLSGCEARLGGRGRDALLDFRQSLRADPGPNHALRVWKAFCRLRELLESSEYLLCYRLRRWLYRSLEVRVWEGEGDPVSYDLLTSFRSARRAVDFARNQYFEFLEGEVDDNAFQKVRALVAWR